MRKPSSEIVKRFFFTAFNNGENKVFIECITFITSTQNKLIYNRLALFMTYNMLTGLGGSGHAEGTTQSAVADGTVIVRDTANQQQDVSTLSRDTEHASGSIDPIFNKEKEQRRLQTAQLIGEIGSLLQKAGKPVTDEAISDQMYQTFYNREFAKTQQGTGGSVQRAITATTAAVQALAGGDLKSAIAGGAAPYLANEIARLIPETDWQARVLAHAVVNAALAAASKKDAATAAAGAATGELAGIIAVDAYHKTVGELSEEEKQTVSALATLASGLAGGLAGDNSASVVAAAQAGKTTVENNYLSQGSLQKYTDEYKKCNGNADCEQKIRRNMAQESAANIQQLKLCWDAGDTACVAESRSKIELNEKAYTELRQQDNMAGRAYEDSAKWYADIIDQCAGRCDWLEASLLKVGADGLVSLAYGALGAGNLPKPVQQVSPGELKFAREISKDVASVGQQTELEFAVRQTKRSAGQIVIKNINPSKAIENLSANGYTKSISKDGSVTVMTKGETVYRFYPYPTGGGLPGLNLEYHLPLCQ